MSEQAEPCDHCGDLTEADQIFVVRDEWLCPLCRAKAKEVRGEK